jgi:ketosteroid isomerase-like protein
MKYDEAFNKNDGAAVAVRFTEDAVQMAPEGGVFRSAGHRKKVCGTGVPAVALEQPYHQTEQAICSRQRDMFGRRMELYRDSDGSTKQVNGYLSTVFVREGDAWKIRMTTFQLDTACRDEIGSIKTRLRPFRCIRFYRFQTKTPELAA